MKDFIADLIVVLGVITLVVVVSFLVAFPVMWLWNYVVPDVFELTKITYWQAWSLNLLSSLLFRSYSSK